MGIADNQAIRGEWQPLFIENAFPVETIFGRPVCTENTGEIVAKKMFRRGNTAPARELFDLAVATKLVPDEVTAGEAFVRRHFEAFVDQVLAPCDQLSIQFDEIDRLDCRLSYDEYGSVVSGFFLDFQPLERLEPHDSADISGEHRDRI